jgi:hypothetical protein
VALQRGQGDDAVFEWLCTAAVAFCLPFPIYGVEGNNKGRELERVARNQIEFKEGGYMSENHANEHSEEIQDRFDGEVEAQDLATNSVSNSLSRRSFLGRACTSTAVAAGSVGFPALLLSETAEARGVTRGAEQSDVNVVEDGSRRNRSFLIRLKAATQEYEIRPPLQRNNGDEALYPNFIGNYSQGLPHNSIGEVEPSAYQALLTAVTSGEPSDFANIPLGGNTKLQDPQGGLAFDLEGTVVSMGRRNTKLEPARH